MIEPERVEVHQRVDELVVPSYSPSLRRVLVCWYVCGRHFDMPGWWRRAAENVQQRGSFYPLEDHSQPFYTSEICDKVDMFTDFAVDA